MPPDRPVRFGRDYDLVRFRVGEDDWRHPERDGDPLPRNDEWQDITIVTVNLNPYGEPFYRNYRVRGGLGVYGEDDYDLDDLVYQAMLDYGFVTA